MSSERMVMEPRSWWPRAATAAALACAAAGGIAVAMAQDRYPSRPVNIIDPYPPAGPLDIFVRPLAGPLERILKQPVVVSYRVGAGGATGIASVANAAPDGHTVLVAPASVATIPEVDKLFGRAPAYTHDQLIGVALFSAQPPVLVVHPSLPVKTVKDFIELARARPREVVMARGTLYGGLHLPMAMLEAAAGIRFRHLATAGGGAAMSAVLSGHAAAYAAPLSNATPNITSGRVRALAHWGNGRLPAFPDVPSFKELGIDVEFYDWIALFAPAKTPPAVLQILQDAARQAVQDPTFKAEMANVNQHIDYRDGAEFLDWYQHQQKRLADTVRAIGRVDEGR